MPDVAEFLHYLTGQQWCILVSCSFLAGDIDTGKAVLRDYINATIGFKELSQVFDKSSKNLMHMFGPKGNPQASNLFAVIQYLQEQEGIHL